MKTHVHNNVPSKKYYANKKNIVLIYIHCTRRIDREVEINFDMRTRL